MARIGGTQTIVGLGIETTPNTPVAATIFPKLSEMSLQGIAEKSMLTSARGIRNMSSDSMIKRKYSQGTIAGVPNVETAPYFFGLALGAVSSATAGGETVVYEHTITVQNANASMKAATVIIERGGTVTERFSNVVCNSLNLEVSDDYATISMDLIGGFPDTSTITESFTQETEFSYQDMTVKFGTSISNADGNSATPLKSFNLNINNNVLVDEAFLSGSNEIVAGGLNAGRLQVTGSYSLHFDGTTELAKYKANTKNAAVVSFTGASIGNAETEEIRIELGKLILTGAPIETNIDGLVVINQSFEVEYDATDVEIKVVVTNEDSGANY